MDHHEPKNYEKIEERESNWKHVDESKTVGNQKECDTTRKPREVKQVQNIAKANEIKEKETKKTDQEKEFAMVRSNQFIWRELGGEIDYDREKENSKISNPVGYVRMPAEISGIILEKKNKENTEILKDSDKHCDRKLMKQSNESENSILADMKNSATASAVQRGSADGQLIWPELGREIDYDREKENSKMYKELMNVSNHVGYVRMAEISRMEQENKETDKKNREIRKDPDKLCDRNPMKQSNKSEISIPADMKNPATASAVQRGPADGQSKIVPPKSNDEKKKKGCCSII